MRSLEWRAVWKKVPCLYVFFAGYFHVGRRDAIVAFVEDPGLHKEGHRDEQDL